MNRQPWHFILVTKREVKDRLRAAYGASWLIEAPAILIVCANPLRREFEGTTRKARLVMIGIQEVKRRLRGFLYFPSRCP
ncbi:MAG: hypothetical protein QW057_09485 [Candidatus Bathyarchaeia archaeon]